MVIPLKTNKEDELCEYNYLTDCTDEHINITYELDRLKDKKVDIADLYKIALWKVNRFPIVPYNVLEAMNNLKTFRTEDIGTEEWKNATSDVLNQLLDDKKVRGVNLPMASTFLRFINPDAYQIIDVRAFRMAFDFTPEKYDKSRQNKNFPALERARYDVYEKYLTKLQAIANDKNGYHGIKIGFQDLDRFLYLVDLAFGHQLKDKKPRSEWRKILNGTNNQAKIIIDKINSYNKTAEKRKY